MRPYRRVKKPIRHRETLQLGKILLKPSKAAWSIWLDIKNIWCREPTLPSFIRIIATGILVWALLVPFLYLLVPPLLTYVSYLVLKDEDLLTWLKLPRIPPSQKQEVYQSYKALVKRATFRVSMMVTLYDYIQTFRAIGAFNHLR